MQQAWDGLEGYDDTDIDEFVTKTTHAVATLKSTAVLTAAGYYTVLAGVRPPAIAVAEVTAGPNLREPFISYWQALSGGNSVVDALAIGRSRIEAVTTNLANSAARQTGDLFIAKADLTVHGWERIPDPGACDWCQMVAESTYDSADSADFGHDRCMCAAAPNF